MQVHRRVTPSIKFGTVRVKCIAQDHNTVSLARAWFGPSVPETSAGSHRTAVASSYSKARWSPDFPPKYRGASVFSHVLWLYYWERMVTISEVVWSMFITSAGQSLQTQITERTNENSRQHLETGVKRRRQCNVFQEMENMQRVLSDGEKSCGKKSIKTKLRFDFHSE